MNFAMVGMYYSFIKRYDKAENTFIKCKDSKKLWDIRSSFVCMKRCYIALNTHTGVSFSNSDWSFLFGNLFVKQTLQLRTALCVLKICLILPCSISQPCLYYGNSVLAWRKPQAIIYFIHSSISLNFSAVFVFNLGQVCCTRLTASVF